MVINAISFFSGISSATGNPIGGVIALFLNIVNTGLKIFQKEKAVKTETESERLERIINKALKEYRETSLKAEWSGYERLSDLFGNNVQFMADFDEENIIETKEKGDKKTFDNVKQAIFDIVVSRLYDVLMSSAVLLGKVEYQISKQCDIEVESAEIKESRLRKQKSDGKTTITGDDKLEQVAKDCLGMYELYSKMNFHRETNFIKHLNIISDILKKEERATNTVKKDSMDSRRVATAYKHLILNVIEQMKENNRGVFKPLVDPLKSVKLRYIINYYHSYPTNYEYLKAYLDNLDLERDKLKDVMFCRKESLTGSCSCLLPIGTAQKPDKYTKEKPFIFRSAFVPDGKVLHLRYEGNGVSRRLEIIGPSVISNMFYKMKDGVNPIREVAVSDGKVINTVDSEKQKKIDEEKERKQRRLFRLCIHDEGAKKDEIMPLHKAVCTDRQETRFPYTYDVSIFETEFNWKGNYISFGSNETDIAYSGEATVESNKKKYKIIWGPFFSPRKMAPGCGSNKWDRIRIYRYKSFNTPEEVQKEIKPVEDPLFCTGENLLCKDDVITKSFFITICKQPEMKGHCQDIPLIKGKVKSKVVDLKLLDVRIHEVNKEKGKPDKYKDVTDSIDVVADEKAGTIKLPFNDKIDECVWITRASNTAFKEKKVNFLQSMKIPEGLQVFLHTDYGAKGQSYGPYIGPITLDKVDGNEGDLSIKSLKISEEGMTIANFVNIP